MSDTREPPVPRPRRRAGWIALAAISAMALAYVVAIALPRYAETSRTETCLANVSLLAQAMRLYSADYNDQLFFGDGDASARPLARGQAGQTPYLKAILEKYVPRASKKASHGEPPSDSPWYCPDDPFARRDFSCDTRWSGTFTYRKAGLGYVAIPHAADRDPGIRALHRRLLGDYGADQMRVDHAFSSYRFVPGLPGERSPQSPTTYIDGVYRLYRRDWGAYGYWDINPTTAWTFEEDLAIHSTEMGGPFRNRIYGKIYAFRDGRVGQVALDMRGFDGYGVGETVTE